MAPAPATTNAPQREIGKDGLCEQIAAFLAAAWPEHLPWTHFPAGEERPSVERIGRDGKPYRYSPTGARLKRMGLKPGWLDFQFILPNAQFASAEVKVGSGAPSPDQRAHAAKLKALKCAVSTWWSLEDCEASITRWLAVFGLTPRITLEQWRARR